MNVFGEVKHSRRKVNQQRNETQEEEPAAKIQQIFGMAQVDKRQHIPTDLEQNHVQEQADVAESFALG